MPSVRTNDIETHYERRGDGPPVVFVHGAFVDHTQWNPQLDALADAYTVVAYDVRGHGHTGGSACETYSIELFAEDLAALVATLDLDRPVVCGLSLGGCIAQVYAERYPDGLSGLVLADTFGPTPLSLDERIQRGLFSAIIPPVRLFGYERVEKAVVWLQERFSEGASGEYEHVEHIHAAGPEVPTAEIVKVARALAGFEDTVLGYRSISVPTLVLYGENDAKFIRRYASALGEAIYGAVVREVPDAGHVANLDNPDFFTGAVREFLDGVDWSGDADERTTLDV